MKYLVIFSCLVLFSCKKENVEHADAHKSQIDYIVISENSFGINDTIGNIQYDSQGRIVQFGNETYTYNANNKVSRITCDISDQQVNSPGAVLEIYYDLGYDSQGRLNAVSDVRFDKPNSGVITMPALVPRSYSLTYVGEIQLPSSLEQAYSSWIFKDDFLIGTALSDENLQSILLNEEGNITKMMTTIKGKKGSRWGPGQMEDFEITRGTICAYDNKANIYQSLFGSLGFVPEAVLQSTALERWVFYAKNNVTKISSNEKNIPIGYTYDAQGRIKEIHVAQERTLKIFYK